MKLTVNSKETEVKDGWMFLTEYMKLAFISRNLSVRMNGKILCVQVFLPRDNVYLMCQSMEKN